MIFRTFLHFGAVFLYNDSETKHLICVLVLGSLQMLCFFAEMNDNENIMRCFPVPLPVDEANILIYAVISSHSARK